MKLIKNTLRDLSHALSPKNIEKEIRSFLKPGSHHQWATMVIIVSVGFFAYLIFLSSLIAPDIQIVQDRFNSLASIYELGGIKQFQIKKSKLRRDVSRTLRANKAKRAQLIATNISLYLFPDLLPDENFEKQVALEQWLPLQQVIEKHPGAHQSRLKFEEMKSNIWNYENPDKAAPKISNTASTILHIYDVMSTR